jgi:hypothetical protein
MGQVVKTDPIKVETPLGKGHVLFVELLEDEHYWTVALQETRAIVTFTQSQLRICRSYTLGRQLGDEEMKCHIKQPTDTPGTPSAEPFFKDEDEFQRYLMGIDPTP